MGQLEGSRKLEAILVADVAGYSRLMQEDDEATVATLEEYRSIFREKIESHGRVVDMAGDSILAVFGAATEAVRIAFAIQTELAHRNETLPKGRRMHFRVGVNVGEIIEKPDGTVYGDGVNIAARLESIGEPGGVTVSGTVFDQVKRRLELDFAFIGEQQVRNIAEPVRAYRVIIEGMPISAKPIAFRPLRPGVRRTLIGAVGVLAVGTLTGSWLWSRAQKLAPPVNNRIAVLPFVNMSANVDDEYFADGITEELISRLSRVKGLEVIAHTSIASYKGIKKKIAEISRELDVGTVLEGSVRRAGSKLRITAQLINAANEAHLWAEDYDREFKDIFDVQTDIAQQVTAALIERIPLSPNAAPGPVTAYTKDLDAYDSYLTGRFFYNKGTVQDLHRALPYLEEAITLDPTYALAYAGLADVYGNLVGNEVATEEYYAKARSCALTALELDKTLAEAHASLGFVKGFHDHDWPGADNAFAKALSLNANSAMTRDWYSYYLLFFPLWDEAIAIQRRAVKLDPLAMIISADLGLVLVHAGIWDAAIDHLSHTLRLDSGNAFVLGALGLAYAGKGMYAEALSAFRKRIDSAGKDPEVLGFVAYASALSGDTATALQTLDEMKRTREPGHAWNFATAYMGLAANEGRYRDDMFLWLDRAHEEHAMDLVDISSVRWKSFRSDPRMIAFRKTLRLPSLNG